MSESSDLQQQINISDIVCLEYEYDNTTYDSTIVTEVTPCKFNIK